jgi:hypothetical protein
MTYIVIFNGHKYGEEKIWAANWQEFTINLSRLVEKYSQAPDLIYLKDMR